MFKTLSQEEQHDYLSISVRIGHLRGLARKCGINPDDVIYTKKVNGIVRVFPGRLLLEKSLPKIPENLATLRAKLFNLLVDRMGQ